MNASNPGRSFSRAAAQYHESAVLHRKIARRLSEMLPPEKAPQVYEIGCGSGFLTEALARLYPQGRIDAVDCAAGMIEVSKEVLGGYGNISWIMDDARYYRPSRSYDLITSSSALQWMQPLDVYFRRLSAVLKPGGRLLFSLMTAGTLKEFRDLRREIAPGKALINGLPESQDVSRAVREAGYKVLRSETEKCSMFFKDAISALRFVKQLGVTGGSLSAAHGRLSRSEFANLLEMYEQRHRSQNGVPVTFVSLYIDAIPSIPSPSATC